MLTIVIVLFLRPGSAGSGNDAAAVPGKRPDRAIGEYGRSLFPNGITMTVGRSKISLGAFNETQGAPRGVQASSKVAEEGPTYKASKQAASSMERHICIRTHL